MENSEKEIMQTEESIQPMLDVWEPTESDMYFDFDEENVIGRFEKHLGYHHDDLDTFVIQKNHFRVNMPNIVKHMNYFLKYYDPEKKFFVSYCSLKYIVDTNAKLSPNKFRKLVLQLVITPDFIHGLKAMAKFLYRIDIDTDKENKYKGAPKLTNRHAKAIITVSFALRLIMPICNHYASLSPYIVNNNDLIRLFSRLFTEVLWSFEESGSHEEIYYPLCRVIQHRIDKVYGNDLPMHNQKKQVHGINYELYLQDLIHTIIIVHALYKLDYRRSVISYIDGIVSKNYNTYLIENYPVKPVEITADDLFSDSSSESFTKAEAIEMAIYHVDESNSILHEANREQVMNTIRKKFKKYIDADKINTEIAFYLENCNLNDINSYLLNNFYSRYFSNSITTNIINREDSIELLVYMKNFLLMKNMIYLPQICTAKILSKFKESNIKIAKFANEFTNADIYEEFIKDKYQYVLELDKKDNIISKQLSNIVNSTFQIVDPDNEINGLEIRELNLKIVTDEFFQFLSII